MRESVSRGALPQSRTSAVTDFRSHGPPLGADSPPGLAVLVPQAAALGSPTEKRRNARKERDGFGTGYGGPKVRAQ